MKSAVLIKPQSESNITAIVAEDTPDSLDAG